MQILVETSARHIHLNKHDMEILFGEGSCLTVRKELSQSGQFASNERLCIVGPKGKLSNVSVLGPLRSKTQIEVSLSDARTLGITTEIRESGDLAGSAGCTLKGPAGSLTLESGVITAKRHIHLDPVTASDFGLVDSQNVRVKVASNNRSLIFDDVVIRVNENFSPAMHIDTDEANAAGITSPVYGEIFPTDA